MSIEEEDNVIGNTTEVQQLRRYEPHTTADRSHLYQLPPRGITLLVQCAKFIVIFAAGAIAMGIALDIATA